MTWNPLHRHVTDLKERPRSESSARIQAVAKASAIPRLSDDDCNNEIEAQAWIYSAVKQLRVAAENMNHLSALRKIDMAVLDAFIADEIPDEEKWNNAIKDAGDGQ